MIKGSVQEDIYVCTEDRSTLIYKANVTDTTEETDSNTIIVGDFNTSLISVERSSRQNINK